MILALADDMTGALEVGAVFASRRFQTVVHTTIPIGPSPDVLVLDTETRHSSPADAFDTIVRIGRNFLDAHLVYKKTDSTLRGNIRSELQALLVLFPHWKIGYSPAYPAQGRTVRNGIVYLNGVPLSGTDFARDRLNPVGTSSIIELLGTGLPCTIFDASTDLDVKNAAKSILAEKTMRLAAGPTALAAGLASQLHPRALPPTNDLDVKTCMVLNGSRTELAQSQVKHAERSGCVSRNEGAPWLLVEPAIGGECSPSTAAAILARALLDRVTARAKPEAVLIVGGDTAYAFVCLLGDPPLEPIGEVLPGVAISRISRSHLQDKLPARDKDLLLITKAGGFGDVDVICRIRQLLTKHAR